MTTIPKEFILAALDSGEDFPIDFSAVWEWIGYSRKDSAKRKFVSMGFVSNFDYTEKSAEEASNSGTPEILISMSTECFKQWAMMAQTERGREVRLYFLEVEKQWKEFKANPITAELLDAHVFHRDIVFPWETENPIASPHLRNLMGVERRSAVILPNAEIQDALGNAFLNLNRSGLAMNKLFHFIDRIPTMQNMGAAEIDSLKEALTEAGSEIQRLQSDGDQKDRMASNLRQQNDRSEVKIGKLEETIAALKRDIQTHGAAQTTAVIVARKVPNNLKSA